MTLRRYITYFCKVTEHYEGEIIIEKICLSDFKNVFNIKDDSIDPLMYDCYPIDKNQAEFFEKKLKIKFDFDKYDYFVECSE